MGAVCWPDALCLTRQGGAAIVLVYDPARPYTFEACRSWMQRIHEVLQPPHSMVRTRRPGGASAA